MNMRWSSAGLLVVSFFCAAVETVDAQEPIRIHANIYRTKTSKNSVKFSPYKSKKNETFLVTVRLYQDPQAEVPLLEALFDHPVKNRIGHLFVETHESRIPDLLARTDALRDRAARMAQPRVNMDWK